MAVPFWFLLKRLIAFPVKGKGTFIHGRGVVVCPLILFYGTLILKERKYFIKG
jgi:hypothetical protein